MAHFEIRHMSSGELTGFFEALAPAKAEADRLCEANNRKEHFAVVKMEDVYVTSTLSEAMEQKPRTLADRARVPANFHD